MNELCVTLENTKEALTELLPSLARFLENHQVEASAVYRVNLAIEEVLLNVIQHAPTANSIVVTIRVESAALTIDVADNGQPFDPHDAPKLDTLAPLEDRRGGGMGVHLLKSLFDSFDYAYEGGQNRVLLVLSLPVTPFHGETNRATDGRDG